MHLFKILTLLTIYLMMVCSQRPVRSIYKGILIARRRPRPLTNHDLKTPKGHGRYSVFGSIPQSVPGGEEPDYFTAYHHVFSTDTDEAYPGMNEQWSQSSPFVFYPGPQAGQRPISSQITSSNPNLYDSAKSSYASPSYYTSQQLYNPYSNPKPTSSSYGNPTSFSAARGRVSYQPSSFADNSYSDPTNYQNTPTVSTPQLKSRSFEASDPVPQRPPPCAAQPCPTPQYKFYEVGANSYLNIVKNLKKGRDIGQKAGVQLGNAAKSSTPPPKTSGHIPRLIPKPVTFTLPVIKRPQNPNPQVSPDGCEGSVIKFGCGSGGNFGSSRKLVIAQKPFTTLVLENKNN